MSSLAGLNGGFWGLSLHSTAFVGVESSEAFILTPSSFESFFDLKFGVLFPFPDYNTRKEPIRLKNIISSHLIVSS